MTTKMLSTIERVDIKDIWRDEAKDFTPWLAKNISLLGDALGMNLETVSQEAAVGSYRLDILARDAGADIHVAIENQLGDTDHRHLGQLLTYTAGYDTKIAIWIAGHFRDEHREALDMLNRRTDENTEFYGVVIELLKIGDSNPAPHFEIVSSPNHWRKSVIRRTKDHPSGNGTEKNQLYYDFFKDVVDRLGARPDAPAPHNVTGRSWQSFKADYAGFGHGVSFTPSHGGPRQSGTLH